jgi:hypothetical protein
MVLKRGDWNILACNRPPTTATSTFGSEAVRKQLTIQNVFNIYRPTIYPIHEKMTTLFVVYKYYIVSPLLVQHLHNGLPLPLVARWFKYTHGRWFSPGTPASSTTKTGRHNIAESGVKHNKLIIDFDLGYLKKVIPESPTIDYQHQKHITIPNFQDKNRLLEIAFLFSLNTESYGTHYQIPLSGQPLVNIVNCHCFMNC